MPGPMRRPGRRVYLVRHGLTDWNAEGRWQGSIDIALSEKGREQARALGDRLVTLPIGAAFSSALQRSRETALLATRERLVPVEEPLLNELSYGAWEGVRDVEVGRDFPEARAAWWSRPDTVRPGGGESLDELIERTWEGLLRCLRRSEGDILVVGHGGVNRVLLARVLGAPLARFWAFDQSPTGVNVLELAEGEPEATLPVARVLLLNCTRHVPGTSDPR